jgi:hypothetical protein
MKTINTILSLATAGTLLFTSCDMLENIAVTLNVNQTDNFLVDITDPTEPDGSAKYAKSETFDLNEGEAKDYVDRIESVDIKTISMKLISFTGEESCEISGFVDFGEGNTLAIPVTNLSQMLANNTSISFTKEDHGTVFEYLQNKAKNDKVFTYTVDAVISNVPVKAEIQVHINATVKAKAEK